MHNLKLFRKRIIPEECIFLKDDIILYADDEYIITKWNSLKPKKDLHHGFSCYFLKEGFKVSKFYHEDHSLMCWYCDIIDYTYTPDEHSYVFTDLLADVIIEPDGFVRVVDLDELADILEKHTLSDELIGLALRRLNHLLSIIYSGEFDKLKARIEAAENA